MKYFWIFYLFVSLGLLKINKLHAQRDTLSLYQIYHTFSNSEKAEWTAFENNWNYFDYAEIKKAFNIKTLNCKNCESFYADIYIEINNEGQLSTVKFLKGKKCGILCDDNFLVSQFEHSLKKQGFTSLKNKRFIARFGHILKC